MDIRPLALADQEPVVALGERCGLIQPWNDPGKASRWKPGVRPHLVLVGRLGGQSVATGMAGSEGHRGWVSSWAVVPAQQRKGLGRALMAEPERPWRAAGCRKINLQVWATHQNAMAFYRRRGYGVDEAVRRGTGLEQDGTCGGPGPSREGDP